MTTNIYSSGLQLVELQRHIERKFSRQGIRKIVTEDIQSCQSLLDQIHLCSVDLGEWIHKPVYAQKAVSLSQLVDVDFKELVIDILAVAMPNSGPMTMTNLAGQCAGLLPYDSYMESVKRISEIIVIMAKNDLFNLKLADSYEGTVITLFNRYGLDEDVAEFIKRSKFLPPMVCKPRKLKKNTDSAYLIHKASSFSRKAKVHNKDICLDTLNKSNAVAYSIDIEYMYAVQDELKQKDDGNLEQRLEQFEMFKKATYEAVIDLINAGNKFYFSHYYDARGRKYCRGYQVSTQGKSFHKGMLNFADAVPIEVDTDLLDLF